jgi:hypothetical protein
MQYNGQKKRTNSDQQNTTQKTKDWAASTPLTFNVISGVMEGIAIPVPQVTPILLLHTLMKTIILH